MENLTTVSSDLFNKIRTRFSDVKIGDESGALTTEPTNARFFDVNFKINGAELGRVNIKIDEQSITVIYNTNMLDNQAESIKKEWYEFLRDIRQFARKNMLKFDTRDITKTNLEKRDYKYLSTTSGDPKMSESKMFGTSKTSYQDLGDAKIIVKHTQPVNYNVAAGRTQHIEAIYIESASGERFRYPHRHLNGARAMAMHVAHGGNVYDNIGGYISGLSEELSKLRQFKNYTKRNGVMAEALGDITAKVMERIDTVKHEVASLQKASYYSQFKESFSPFVQEEVPEDTVNQWVDALTIKTFNEELKTVFPYIYKLVAEKSSLSYDDLVSETQELVDIEETSEDSTEFNHLADFEQHLEDIATFEYDESDEWDRPNDTVIDPRSAIQYLNQLKSGTDLMDLIDASPELGKLAMEIAEQFGLNPSRDMDEIEEVLISTLRDASAEEQYPDDYENEGASNSAEQSSSPITQEVIEFITSMYDSESGSFPRGEEGVKIACEKKFGEQAGQFANFVVEKLASRNESLPGAIIGSALGSVASTAADSLMNQQEEQSSEMSDADKLARIKSLAGM